MGQRDRGTGKGRGTGMGRGTGKGRGTEKGRGTGKGRGWEVTPKAPGNNRGALQQWKLETEGTLFSYVRSEVGPGPSPQSKDCFEKSSEFPLSSRTYVQHMAELRHKCDPPPPRPLVSFLHSAPNKLGQRHNPTICQ